MEDRLLFLLNGKLDRTFIRVYVDEDCTGNRTLDVKSAFILSSRCDKLDLKLLILESYESRDQLRVERRRSYAN